MTQNDDANTNDGFIVWAPEDVRDHTLVRSEGEDDASYEERVALMDLILKNGGF